jgi:putative transcriptional regulator
MSLRIVRKHADDLEASIQHVPPQLQPETRTFSHRLAGARCKGPLTHRCCQATFPLTSRLDTIEMRNTIRELRTGRGLSQGQLAAAMSVSRQTINSIEQERYTPSLPLALALARYFETTVEDMFDGNHAADNGGNTG